MISSSVNINTVSYDPADGFASIPAGVSISLPLDITLEISRPIQQDLFKHYVTSHWLPYSSIPEEDDHDAYVINWCKSLPYLAEAWHEQNLEYDIAEDTNHVHVFYTGNELDYCAWRIRWSEYFETRNTNLII